MTLPLNIFIGYDRREFAAYSVAKHSIETRSSVPVLVHPLVAEHLSHFVAPPVRRGNSYWDIESEAPASTEFTRTRFCVPFIQKHGWALFTDGDILLQDDIAKLFKLADERYAVMVVKHEYVVNENTKMDGQLQTAYHRKNWSSVILWNCSHRAHLRLTRDRLNRWPGRRLHAFEWLEDDEIGTLPQGWNHLVGITNADTPERPSLLHFTLGTPDMYVNTVEKYTDLWLKEQDAVNRQHIHRPGQASIAVS